jgi:type II secretory pathway component PulK
MRGRERGYALILVMVIVTVLGLAAMVSAQVVRNVASAMSRMIDDRDNVVAAESVMSRVAFMLVTREPLENRVCGAEGCENGQGIRLDGTWQEVPGARSGALSVQDEAGLFSLNGNNDRGVANLLVLSGDGDAAPRLSATLMDFIDGDDLTRARGAEQQAYAGLGLPPPADRPLFSRWEALDALGWSEAVDARSGFWNWVAAGPVDPALNVNTAPLPVIEAVSGDRRRARAFAARRDASALADIQEAEALLAGESGLDGVVLTLVPGRAFRVQAVFGSQRQRRGIERRLELGIDGEAAPFTWTEERDVTVAPTRDAETTTTLSLGTPAS